MSIENLSGMKTNDISTIIQYGMGEDRLQEDDTSVCVFCEANIITDGDCEHGVKL